MTRIEFTILDQNFSVLVHDAQLMQVFCGQQALPIEDHSQGVIKANFTQGEVQFDITQLAQQQLGISIDGKQWQWLELPATQAESKKNFFGLAALGFKLVKSANVIKAALAGASLAGYAWLFSWQFAIMLVACLVVHEYGHVRAMQYFKIKTKGIYLIPFVGGLAVSDDKITTRWQDVVISLMGPAFGLITSILGVVLYYATELEIFAAVAVLSALLNLFNLLPILPLDGGHVLKSISFSMRSWVGLLVCMAGVGFGLWLSYTFGLMLLVFFLFVGSLEILFEWRARHASHLLPLDRYGQVFSAVMYILVVAGHVAVMMHFADSENVILSLPMKVLSS
ncbi:site-2 protease family protein [Pseudoalteromonas sp. S16_S37]|uniref:site-2 protease family protein n=1 Tax=Pseudoalteromonas sp. S16_S37 TaxID=2720228 RepID=UPI001681B513|nr:site-2 protease family protein [Pseudoalteromonas sp. S16_S37]MBD1584378.1 site-2 protease family protein [Pseudoalteromonas sp. S16_S37]